MSTTVDLGKITASVTVGTTTTGAAGTNASVSNSGTTQDAVLNFTIPRGAQGVQGPQGSTGPQGPAGPTGPQGPMGDVAVITPEQQAAFTMYSVPGQNTDGPMTQKAVTDALGNIAASSVSYNNSQSGLASGNVQGAIDYMNSLTPSITDVLNTDLDISDEHGHILARFSEGEVKTKNFDSGETVVTEPISIADIAIVDESGKILLYCKDGHIKTKNFDSYKSKSKIKILAIGNSWTGDAFNYLGVIMDEVLINNGVDIHIGFCYQGGGSLQNHYNNLINNNTYTFYQWISGSTSWSKSTMNINDVLTLTDWDVVVLQQVSTLADDYTTYQPYLNDCLDIISSRVNNTVKFGWNLVRERVDTPNVFEDISEAAQNLLKETLIQFILPCGTALQNARTTSLDNLGDGGHLTYDGSHLQEGIPCLVESYAATIFFLNLFGFQQKGINGSIFEPTQEWIDAHGMDGQSNGSSVGVTDANVILAKKCATIAVNNPFVITNCSNL